MADQKIQSTDAADSVLGPTTTSAGKRDDDETFDNFESSPAVPRSKRLVIDLDPVPKFLKTLVDDWATESMSTFSTSQGLIACCFNLLTADSCLVQARD